jgi:hypothetical protein
MLKKTEVDGEISFIVRRKILTNSLRQQAADAERR